MPARSANGQGTAHTATQVGATPPADVAIVGYGPVGATLAVLLAQRGRAVAILERRPHPYPLPRAVHMDDHTARILQAAGLGAELPAITEPAPVYEWRNGAGTTLLRIGRHGDGPSGWPTSAMFHQPDLEIRLRRRADQLGVVVHTGADVTALDQRDDHVELVTAAGERHRARWVVGADGASSTVRRLCGLPMVGLEFSSDWLIVDAILDPPRTFEPTNLQVCDPRRPTTAVSGGPARRRWEFMRMPGEPVEALGTHERAWELLAPWDVHPANTTIERHTVYTFAARWAERWRADRVLLAGDAAHQMPPFAGQGLCAGMRDAANLAWKLDAVLAGVAGDTVLDAYEVERRADVAASIEFSVELGRIICVSDPTEAAARDEAMAAAVGDEPAAAPDVPPITDGVIDGSPGAGEVWPQGCAGGRRSDDVEGAWWRLVVDGALPRLDGDLATWWSAIGGRTLLADPADAPAGRWLAAHGAAAALVRPDFHVYGTATDAAGGAALAASLRRQLAALG